MRLWEHFDEIDISRNISKAIIFVVGAPLVEEQTGSEIDPRGVIFQYACYTVRTSYSAMLYNIHIYPHHRLDLAPRIYQTPTSMRHDFFAPPRHVHVIRPSPHRLLDLQDTLHDKLMHFLPQLSDFVPLKNGFL